MLLTLSSNWNSLRCISLWVLHFRHSDGDAKKHRERERERERKNILQCVLSGVH
uniref:Uncharacterized protein n=1 Tax=Chrysemys picta bellii TaxID=8478 RepID=A0A8C3FAA0_CHRPI